MQKQYKEENMEITNGYYSGTMPVQTYKEFKGLVDREFEIESESFVRLGYYLRCAENSNILYESGYKSIFEFGEKEYGLKKDVVSRYVNINKRFSEGGFSSVLKKEFQGYGRSKLAEMLTLPDNLIELMTPDMTRDEIIEVKKEYAEEQETSDIELAIEAAEQPEEEQEASMMERFMFEFFKQQPEEYIYMPKDSRSIREYLKPGDSRLIICRIPGKGKWMMSLTDAEEIKLSDMRQGETVNTTWSELIKYVQKITPEGYRKQQWCDLYHMPYPEEPEKEPEKVQEKKKKVKVDVVKPKKPKVAPVQPVKVEVVPGVEAIIEDEEKASEAAEQEIKKAEIMAVPEHTEEPESLEKTESEAITEESYKERMNELKTAGRLKLNEINECIAMNLFIKAILHIKEAMILIDQMEKLDNLPIIEEG